MEKRKNEFAKTKIRQLFEFGFVIIRFGFKNEKNKNKIIIRTDPYAVYQQ